MSTSTGPGRLRSPISLTVLLALAVATVLALRAAVADKGGSYDPAEAGR